MDLHRDTVSKYCKEQQIRSWLVQPTHLVGLVDWLVVSKCPVAKLLLKEPSLAGNEPDSAKTDKKVTVKNWSKFLDALASLDFKLSVSQSLIFFYS